MKKKSYAIGILLGAFVIGLPYAIGFSVRSCLIIVLLLFVVPFLSSFIGVPFLSTAIGAVLGYIGVREYNAMVDNEDTFVERSD